MSSDWRMRHRAYGVHVPLDECELYLAQGWRLADSDLRASAAGGCVLLRPPAHDEERAA